MKIIKYYCDICKKEVDPDKDLIITPYMIESGEHRILTTKEICKECVSKMSKFLREERYKSDI